MSAVDIISQMEQFSEEEKARIDLLACNAVDNITFEDMQLYSRWQTSVKLAEERFAAELAAIKNSVESRNENNKRIADASVEAFRAQAELAKARLKAVENGQV